MSSCLNTLSRFLISAVLTVFACTASMAWPLEVQTVGAACCCVEKNTIAFKDSCACCKNIPEHSLPTDPFKLQLKSSDAFSVPNCFTHQLDFGYKVSAKLGVTKPLHLASNKLYLKNRVLLI